MTASINLSDTHTATVETSLYGESTVRAFEPRYDTPYGRKAQWTCRGRLANTTRPITRYTGKTVQCAAKLEESWTWCPKCGALLAWNGRAIYNGRVLTHLERVAA